MNGNVNSTDFMSICDAGARDSVPINNVHFCLFL